MNYRLQLKFQDVSCFLVNHRLGYHAITRPATIAISPGNPTEFPLAEFFVLDGEVAEEVAELPELVAALLAVLVLVASSDSGSISASSLHSISNYP
jgi:hypothetical protein